MDKIIAFIFLIGLLSMNCAFSQTNSQHYSAIHDGVIIVKINPKGSPDARIASHSADPLDTVKKLAEAVSSEQVFPSSKISNARLAEQGLQYIYKLHLAKHVDVWRTIAQLQHSGLVEYAEPHYRNEILYIPNDPQADPISGQQNYLSVVKAYDAWNIQKSDTNMVIAIVDTGVKMDHEDLGNIAFNYADPINGIDDDGDGYIDNYHGWDVADRDNDPTADGHPHGTEVAGMSSATTNNNIGMAGTGFKSKYLPVKIAETSTSKLVRDYEGVIYAADHGARVINLSWGAADYYSQYGQDVINYAVLEKDAVVVAAGGNKNEQLDYYPASYENVLSVGATDINDNKASWATYSYNIDIMAPGHQIYTTRNNGGYLVTTGSSYAAPLVAGAAALVRSQFPSFNATQVMEQLRVTSDDIYDAGTNMEYFGMLGRGRLNMYRAVTDILTPSVRMSNLSWNGRFGELIFPGDEVEINLEFTNYLRQAENLTITITGVSEHLSMQENVIHIPSLGEKQVHTVQQPLRIRVDKTAKSGTRLVFRIDYLGNFYKDFQYFEIPLTPDYFEISDGNLTATISGDGDIGFDDVSFRNGSGILYKEQLLALHAGLIISQSPEHVMNNVANDFDTFSRDQDFKTERSVRLYDNSLADYDARSVFKPFDTLESRLPVRIEQKALAGENSGQNGFLIFEYRLINTGDSILHGLNAGIFADWNLGDQNKNAAETDLENKTGYVYSKSTEDLYAGLALLSSQDFSHFAIDMDTFNNNPADFDGLFTDSLKHALLSSAVSKNQAGVIGAGNDVSQIAGARNISLKPGESTKVAIAMLVGETIGDFKDALITAREKYGLYLQNPPRGETFYACTGDSALIDPEGDWFEIYSDAALTNRLDSATLFLTPPVQEERYYYTVNLDSGYRSDAVQIVVKPGNPFAAFSAPDTVLVESGNIAEIHFTNESQLSDRWHWDFGNGYAGTVEHPRTFYEIPGIYEVKLNVSNPLGCTDSIAHKILITERTERPLLTDQIICKNTSATVNASNTDKINVFADAPLQQLVFSGDTFHTGVLKRDTVFYVTNTSGTFQSIAVPVKINVLAPDMGFEYFPDTINITDNYVLRIRDHSIPVSAIQWFIDGELISEANEFNYDYTSNAFDILQVKTDGHGCRDSLTLRVIPAQSEKPEDVFVELCRNSSLSISPQGGNTFYFYSDPETSRRIHKGRKLEVEAISEHTSFYFTNIDNLLESPVSEIHVQINPVQAMISVRSDSVELTEAQGVQIEDQSVYASESLWIFPDGTIETSQILIENYDEAGTYSYHLVALAGNACSDTTHQDITVYSITGLDNSLPGNIRMFPNPVSSDVHIDMGRPLSNPVSFKLINASGQIVENLQIDQNQTGAIFNIEHLPPGIYTAHSQDHDRVISFRLIKK